MSDYISREDALRELCATKCGRNFSDCNSTGPCIYGRIISKLPSADVRENKGEWIPIDDFPHEVWECDHCGFVIDGSRCIEPTEYRDMYNYCPNCGADMRGVSE